MDVTVKVGREKESDSNKDDGPNLICLIDEMGDTAAEVTYYAFLLGLDEE